jgi:hypothetical protein
MYFSSKKNEKERRESLWAHEKLRRVERYLIQIEQVTVKSTNDRIHISGFAKISNNVVTSSLAHLSLYHELELI